MKEALQGSAGGKGARKEQIRGLLARGVPPRQIAARLGITTQAVYFHMETIRKEEGEDGS